MLAEPFEQHIVLRDLEVPLTAGVAFRAAWPVVRGYDPGARLVLVTSGEDLDDAGRATFWEFHFDLPDRRAQATLSVGLPAAPDDEDRRPPCTLLAQMRPFVPPGDLWEIMRAGEEAERRYYAEQWRKQLAGRPPLPIPFHDSARAAEALAAQGVEFHSGHGLYLGGRVQVTGEAVWYITVAGEVYTTPFAAPVLPAPAG